MLPRPEFDDSRLARALRSLPRLGAPAKLDAQVAQDLEAFATSLESPSADSFEAESEWSDELRSLPRIPAPSVLDRLVAEEIVNPAALSERFVGDLPVPSGQPAILTFDMEAASPPRAWAMLRRPVLRAGLALATAAGLLIWLAPPDLFGTRRAKREFNTPFVWADQVGDLDPTARLLAEGLLGGSLDSSAR